MVKYPTHRLHGNVCHPQRNMVSYITIHGLYGKVYPSPLPRGYIYGPHTQTITLEYTGLGSMKVYMRYTYPQSNMAELLLSTYVAM